LFALIEAHYPRGEWWSSGLSADGDAAFPSDAKLVRLQRYSDPAMEEALYETTILRQFAGLSLERIPDETTILNFRPLLEKHELAAGILAVINGYLGDRGLSLRQGTIVDATLINAPSSTKSKDGKRDPDMHQTKKGNQFYFGMKAHIGVDDESGLVHSVVARRSKWQMSLRSTNCCTARKTWSARMPVMPASNPLQGVTSTILSVRIHNL
jgi:IS5 family transposase